MTCTRSKGFGRGELRQNCSQAQGATRHHKSRTTIQNKVKQIVAALRRSKAVYLHVTAAQTTEGHLI